MVGMWPQSRLGPPTKMLSFLFLRQIRCLLELLYEAGLVALGDSAVSSTATVLGVLMPWSGRSVLMKSSHQYVQLTENCWKDRGAVGWVQQGWL